MKRGNRALNQYIQEFRKLRSQADMSSMRMDVQVQYFLDGLEPYSLRQAVITRGPKTIQEAFTAAMELDS